jgi:hypothetical protein
MQWSFHSRQFTEFLLVCQLLIVQQKLVNLSICYMECVCIMTLEKKIILLYTFTDLLLTFR